MPGRRFRQPGGEPPSGNEQVEAPVPTRAPTQAQAPPTPPRPPAQAEAAEEETPAEEVEGQTVPVEEWLPHQRSDWVSWWDHDPAEPGEVPDDVMEKLRAEAEEKYAKYPKDKSGDLPPDVREEFEAEKAAYGQRAAPEPGQPVTTEPPSQPEQPKPPTQ
jgi:hypothetical protein